MFCFEVDRDVAEELSRRNLGIHLAEAIQERVESRMLEAYPGLVAEVFRLARQPDALTAEEAVHPARVRGVGSGGRLVPDNEQQGLPADTRIYDAAGLGGQTADPIASEDPADLRASFDLILHPTSRSRPSLPRETVRVRVESGATPVELAAQIASAYLSMPAPRDETLTVTAPARIDRQLLPDLTQALALAADSQQLRVRFYLGDLGPMNICGSPCVA
jgi:hypothetical protein